MKRIVVKIFNLIFIALAIVSCTFLLTKPFISTSGSIGLRKEDITNLLKEPLKDQLKEEEIANCVVLDEDGTLKVGFSLTISNDLIFHYNDIDNTNRIINEQLTGLVNDTVGKLKPTISNLAALIAKKGAKDVIHEQIANEISKNYHEIIDADSIMEECGINDEYLSNFTDEIYDYICEDDPTIDGMMEVIEVYIVEVCSMLDEGGVEGFGDIEGVSEQINDEIRNELTNMFLDYGLCDEDGNINDIDDVIDDFIILMLDSLLTTDSEETDETKNLLSPLLEKEESTPEEEESKLTKKITELLFQKINELKIGENFKEYGVVALAFLIFLLFPWIILIIQTLINTFRHKRIWTNTWYVFLLAFIQVILGIGVTLSTKNLSQIMNLLPLSGDAAIAKTIQINATTSSLVPSIIYLVMIVLVIIYSIFRRGVKNENKKQDN